MRKKRKKIKNNGELNDELRDEYLEAYDEIITKIRLDILNDGLTEFNVRILKSFQDSKKDFEKRFC